MKEIDYILLGIIVIVFLIALRKVIKDFKNGTSCNNCSGDCATCRKR